MRVDAMLDKGDLDGQAVWLKTPGTMLGGCLYQNGVSENWAADDNL